MRLDTFTLRRLGVALLAAMPALAQQQQAPLVPDTGVPTFKVDVVSRTIKVINFHHRQGTTEMQLKGTALAPNAKGFVRIDSKTGATKIDASIDKLVPPQSQGGEYLTYVMWAITPEGRPENLGEIHLDRGDDDARLQAATELQSFGLIITAEPYFSVTQPSDVIVAEAVVGKGTTGTISPLEAKYELWPKGMYVKQLPAARRVWSPKTGKEGPPALEQAYHAVEIARSVGADRYAADTLRKADTDLENATAFFRNKGDTKKIQTLSRNAAQLAEDARLISMKKAEEERLEAERVEAANRLAAARTATEQEARRRELAEAERRSAQEREVTARLMAEQETRQRQRLETEKAAAIAEQERLAAQKAQIAAQAEEARRMAADADAKRLAAEQAQKAAVAEQAKLQAQQEQLRREAEEARLNAARAEQSARDADAERTRLRNQLREQLNSILSTKETARGLIVNMSDVLFEFGKYDLRPGAREKLARISGILATHPDLKLAVEGHTDSVGSDEFNQKLSEQRAEAVQRYMVAQGVKSDSIQAAGFGESRPVASNLNEAGRQQNRRVEIVVSGESIQTTTTTTTTRTGGPF